jgi:hypothetical protein
MFPTLDANKNHIISFSGGSASALAGFRLFEQALLSGVHSSKLYAFFADTLFEDEDLYRFNQDVFTRWEHMGVSVLTACVGMTPLDIAAKAKLIPNSHHAPCSRELKIKPFTEFLSTLSGEGVVYLGMDWREIHRHDAPKKNYGKIGYEVDYPLMWKPYELGVYSDVLEKQYNIRTPHLYTVGHPHNNCGGRCVKQGVKEWLRLRISNPQRFYQMMEWEENQRAKGGARSKRAFCTEMKSGIIYPLPLLEINRRFEAGEYGNLHSFLSPSNDDKFGCFCETA